MAINRSCTLTRQPTVPRRCASCCWNSSASWQTFGSLPARQSLPCWITTWRQQQGS